MPLKIKKPEEKTCLELAQTYACNCHNHLQQQQQPPVIIFAPNYYFGDSEHARNAQMQAEENSVNEGLLNALRNLENRFGLAVVSDMLQTHNTQQQQRRPDIPLSRRQPHQHTPRRPMTFRPPPIIPPPANNIFSQSPPHFVFDFFAIDPQQVNSNWESDRGHPTSLTLEQITSIPARIYYAESGTEERCTICQQVLESSSQSPGGIVTTVKTLPCRHIFHAECINHWLSMADCCPLCRVKAIDEETPEPPLSP